MAVVHDADDLTLQDMADFARWTNLSETTFLIAPTDERADYQLRIFTTQTELPFAGHPTRFGPRLVAGRRHRQEPQELVQQCGAGLVRIRRDGTRLAFAAPPLIRGGDVDAEDLIEIMNILDIDPAVVVDAQWADNGPAGGAVAHRRRDSPGAPSEDCRLRPIQRRRGDRTVSAALGGGLRSPCLCPASAAG